MSLLDDNWCTLVHNYLCLCLGSSMHFLHFAVTKFTLAVFKINFARHVAALPPFDVTSVTRLGNLFKFLATNLLTKSAHKGC